MRKIVLIFFIAAACSKEMVGQNVYVDSLINWLKTHHTIDSQYILTLHRISYKGIDNDLKRSFAYYEKVSYYSDSLHFIYGKALAQINLGILFSFSANYDASNKAYFKAIEYADSCGGLRLQAVSLNNVGDNFKALRDFAKCRQYANEAIAINTKLKAWRGVAINYELLSLCDIEDKLYDSARLNLDRGMQNALLSKDSALLSLFYLGYGKLFGINNQQDSALLYFDRAMSGARYFGDPENEFKALLGKVKYIKALSADEKLLLLKKAMAIAQHTGNLERIVDGAHQLFLVYDEKKDKDSTLAWFNIYHNAADSLFSENNKRNVAIKETEWIVKRKEIENNHLKDFTQLQNKELAFKNGLLLAVLISLLLSIVIAIVVNKSVKNNKRNAESQLKQNIAETQMQVLRSQMNPHFIFNSLNSIDAYIQSNDKYNATVYLNKFARLVRNVLDSSKQNLVSFSKDIETLKLYIELELQRSENKFTADLEIEDDLINSDYKVPPLIIQPFVENAIIHGLRNKDSNDGVLVLHIYKHNNRIVYIVKDNGIGRAAASQMGSNKDKSYGMEMTYERVKLFNRETTASIEIEDLYENNRPRGTQITVQLNII
jgi:type II secretory pathway pseudopilin PulG